MKTTTAAQQTNAKYNPLYLKMKKRFCVGGTIAEKMEKKANDYMKASPVLTFSEYHMTHANSLPARAEKSRTRTFSGKKSVFSLRRISTACMVLLVGGTLLFSGATVSSFFATDKGDAAELFLHDASAKTLAMDDVSVTEDTTRVLAASSGEQ